MLAVKYIKQLKCVKSSKYAKTYVDCFGYFSMSLEYFEIKMKEKGRGKRDRAVSASSKDPMARFCRFLSLLLRSQRILLSPVL